MSVSRGIEASMRNSSWIRRMFEEGGRLKEQHGAKNVYDYTLGNPSLNPPLQLQQKLQELASRPSPGMHGYMHNAGFPHIRENVARHLNILYGLEKPLTESHVIMTCGAAGGLNVIFRAVLNPGEEVIVPTPYFVDYGFYVDNHGGKLVPVKTKENFQLDLEAIKAAITPQTKAILINSPNNPTGVIYSRKILEKLQVILQERLEKQGQYIYLIADEPYTGIVFDNAVVPPVLQIFPGGVSTSSYSKSLGLAGERIGRIAIGPQNPYAEALFNAMTFSNRTLGFVNASATWQLAIIGMHDLVVGLEEYQARRDILYRELTALGFQMQKPQGTFYLFPQSPIADDVKFCQKALEYLLLLVPGSGFAGPGYFRMSFSSISQEQIYASLGAFKQLAKYYGLSS